MNLPFLVDQTPSYLVVYKPPRMHCAPLDRKGELTLLDWCAQNFPEVKVPRGRKAVEGGLLHRLDQDTEGLVLVARTQGALDFFLTQQERGFLVKEYHAGCTKTVPGAGLEGFPPPPENRNFRVPFGIKSAFRPYGLGRRSVRPVLPGRKTSSKYKKETAWDGPGPYKTEVLELREEPGNRYTLRLRLLRGFRHQIRCHLSWIGFPILSDPLYGGLTYGPGTLALRADFLGFTDPETGELREYRLPPVEP